MTKRAPRRRAKRVRGLYYSVEGITPENVLQAIGRLRREAQDEIDRLLTFLDLTEDADAEPSLAATHSFDQSAWAAGSSDDHEGCAHDGREPSLGATESICQSHWSAGENDDCEDQHDGREPNGDEHDASGDDLEPLDYGLTAADRKIRRRLQCAAARMKAQLLANGSDGVLVAFRRV